ncbi:MAG: molybdate ABC transporter permease subunit, partial [Plesiomonas sp.]
MSVADWQAVWLTLKLAASTTCVLMLFSPWLAWWLARSQSRIRPLIESLVSLPLVLPPTVLGFYLLLAFSPQSLPGSYWQQLTGQTLAFSFSGLVIASVLYSLPFAVQPLQSAFVNMGDKELNAARTLGFNGIA